MDTDYYAKLSSALASSGIAHPTLILDLERLEHNIEAISRIKPEGKAVRIVAKSLPSIPLLERVMTKLNTRRLMCFHLPFLMHLVEQLAELDVLMGKPMPPNAARFFYRWLAQNKQLAASQSLKIQWLIDSEQRLNDYGALAAQLGITLNINLEVDIGLHRGGIRDLECFQRCLRYIKQSGSLNFSGIMGYEAHITRIPLLLGGASKAAAQAEQKYSLFVDLVEEELGSGQDYCLNTGGSTTFPLYNKTSRCNEVALASALVKPSDFDVATLQTLHPALFIATPILKTIDSPELPMAPRLSSILRLSGLLPREAVFIYGGNWLATPTHPKDSRRVSLYGRSSNQEMYSLPSNHTMTENDIMFFRPTQSEALMLQFGKLAVYQKGRISDWWPCFQYPDSLYQAVSCPPAE